MEDSCLCAFSGFRQADYPIPSDKLSDSSSGIQIFAIRILSGRNRESTDRNETAYKADNCEIVYKGILASFAIILKGTTECISRISGYGVEALLTLLEKSE